MGGIEGIERDRELEGSSELAAANIIIITLIYKTIYYLYYRSVKVCKILKDFFKHKYVFPSYNEMKAFVGAKSIGNRRN